MIPLAFEILLLYSISKTDYLCSSIVLGFLNLNFSAPVKFGLSKPQYMKKMVPQTLVAKKK